MGCYQIKKDNIAEQFIIDFISSYKISHHTFEDFCELIENFDKRIILVSSSESKTPGLKEKQTIAPLKKITQKFRLSTQNIVQSMFKKDKDKDKAVKEKASDIDSFSSIEDDLSKDKELFKENEKIKLVERKITYQGGESETNFKQLNNSEKTDDIPNINPKRNKRFVSFKSINTLKTKNEDLLTDHFDSTTNHITIYNFKSSLSNLLTESIFDKYSFNYIYQCVLISEFENLTVENYKIHLFAWAFGLLEHKNIKTDFLYILDMLYQDNASFSSLKEFLSFYIHYSIVGLNDLCFGVCYQNREKVINGYLVNNELLIELKNLKSIYKGSIIKNYYARLLSLFKEDKAYITNNFKKSFNKLHSSNQRVNLNDTSLIRDNHGLVYEYLSNFVRSLTIEDSSLLEQYLNVNLLRKSILDNYNG